MSADILRRAAKTLREHAEMATPGPWEVVPPTEDVLFSRVQSTSLTGWQGEVAEIHTPDERWPDHEYIALMSPPVALALAEWLEAVAVAATYHERDGFSSLALIPGWTQAVNTARAILREAPDA